MAFRETRVKEQLPVNGGIMFPGKLRRHSCKILFLSDVLSDVLRQR